MSSYPRGQAPAMNDDDEGDDDWSSSAEGRRESGTSATAAEAANEDIELAADGQSQDESPNEMFGKIMSISDELMWRWFELLSFRSIDEIKALKADQARGKNPRDIKIDLAKELIARFHDEQSANLAEENFINQFQKKNIPDNIEEISFSMSGDSMPLANLLKECGMTSSTSEAMRMIEQGAVRVDEKKIIDTKHIVSSNTSAIYQVGKRKFKKITL